MTSLTAHFDGNVIVPEQPVDLPVGCRLEVRVRPLDSGESSKSALAKLAELADHFPTNPKLPVDGAAEHDHYLYGVPKQP